MRATAEEVIQAYKETGSVWRAGKLLGMSGQSVHERLVALDYPLAGRKWTDAEVEEMRTLIENKVPLGEVARRLGRPYAGVAGKASELGVRADQAKERKVPRGQGYDKVSVRRHLKALEESPLKVTQYARKHGLHVDPLVKAIQRHFPDRWMAYVETHSPLPKKDCEYCGQTFHPNSGKQRFCSRKCQADGRSDASYFGGKRRSTVGLAEGVCQLCGRSDIKGLSSHHVLGKQNDPDNDLLVALCPGCHQVVTLLAARTFVDDVVVWQSLISLVWLRKHGPEIVSGEVDDVALYVEVIMDLEEPDET